MDRQANAARAALVVAKKRHDVAAFTEARATERARALDPLTVAGQRSLERLAEARDLLDAARSALADAKFALASVEDGVAS